MRVPAIHVGWRMRIAREEAGFEMRDFAELVGISTGTIINYEKGRTKPKRLALKAWSEITDVPVSWLEYGLAEAPSPTPVGAAISGASGGKLPRMDSNHQPADYRVITSLDEKLARTRAVQEVRRHTPRPSAPNVIDLSQRRAANDGDDHRETRNSDAA